MKTFGNTIDVRPLPGVPVELLNTIGVSTVALIGSSVQCDRVNINEFRTHLEAIRVFVARPSTSVGVEKKALFVLVGDVVIHILS